MGTIAEGSIDLYKDPSEDYLTEVTDASSRVVKYLYGDSVALIAGDENSTDSPIIKAEKVTDADGTTHTSILLYNADTINIGGLSVATVYSNSASWAAGTHTFFNTAVTNFIDKFRGKQIVSCSGCFTNGTMVYPLSSPMMNSSGAYSASWGHLIDIDMSTNKVNVVTSSTWSNYKLSLTVIYINND